MNWELLKIFSEVCKDFNISKAAERLGRSQSAVSQRITKLEESLQSKLFDVKSSGLHLTPEGKNILILANGMSEQYDEWKVRSEFNNSSHYNSLEVEIGQTLATMWLPHYIDIFCGKKNDINMKVRCISDESNYLENYGDLCISTYLENRDDLLQDFLMTFHLGLYASPEYLEKHGVPTKTTDLREHRLMSYGTGIFHQYGEKINEIFRENGAFNSGCFIEINSGQSLVTLASKGHGIIALSGEYPGLTDSNLVRILPEIENNVDIFISIPNHKKSNKSANIFKELMQNEIRNRIDQERSEINYDGFKDNNSREVGIIQGSFPCR